MKDMKRFNQNGPPKGMDINRQKRIPLAAIGAILGGILWVINHIWQGYLDLTPGKEAILHDVTHPAYYLNTAMLLFAMVGLLVGLFSLNNHISISAIGPLWRIGFYLSFLGQGFFALGNAGFLLHGIIGLSILMDAINVITGISNLVMFLGALPIGFVLFRRIVFPRLGSILFLLTVPGVAFSVFFVYNLNELIAGIIIGCLYGGAWIITGYFLWKLAKNW
jgi:hypothetical protein